MATTEKYTTVIELNSEQAKHQLDELRKQVASWKSDLAEAREKKMGKSFIAAIRKELTAAEKELKKYDNEVARTIETMNDLNSASVERIEEAQKNLLRLSKEVPHDSPYYEQLDGMLDQVTQELENIRATKAFEQLQLEAKGATKSAGQLKAELAFIKQTADNAETASVKQLQLAERTAQNIKNSAQKGSDEWNQASAGLETVRTRLSAIEEEERKVVTVIDRYNKELEQAGKKAEKVKSETELIDRTMGKLSSASVRDIEYSIKMLNEQLRDTERTGGNVEQLTEKLKLLNAELKKVQDMQAPDKEKDSIFSRFITGLNKNWGAITQIIGAITGLTLTVRRSVDAFAEMDQEMKNVRKYTGQTDEEVKAMNEDFKKMDTRTPREQLNHLAGAAGRLGVKSTEAAMDFVYAGDIIGLAMRDDLGDDAVEKVGKLTMAFGEDERLGLRGAMLSTGSAVNELSQNTAANAGYLVDFTARLSGVGVQAEMTQAQILGIAAAMDENMQKDEMAATAVSQIITKMTTDSDTFARIAGKNVEEFSSLVKNDMNTALLQFFEAMNKKGGFTELAPLFDQMGLDGTRAIGVLSTLASKIDDVRKYQEMAAEAYRDQTSVVKEAEIQNNTYQAQLEKARKKFNDLKVELGKNLLPVVTMTITSGGLLVKALSIVAEFVLKCRTTIITLTVAIAAWNAATIASITWNRMLKPVLEAATLAVKNLYKAIAANPWGAAVAGIALVVSALYDLSRASNEASAAQRQLKHAENEAKKQAVDEAAEMEQLMRQINLTNESTDKRKELLEKINGKLMQEHLGNLTEEDIRTGKATETLKEYNKALQERIRKEILMQKMTEAIKKKEDAENGKVDWTAADYIEQFFFGSQSSTKYTKGENGELVAEITDRNTRIKERVIQEQNEIIEAIQQELDDDYVTNYIKEELEKRNPNKDNGGRSDTVNYDTRSFWEQELKDRRAKLKALRDDAKATAADIDQAAKDVKEAEDKMELFIGRKAAVKEERAEDKARRERERKANDAAKAETEQQLAELTHRYAMGQILYCDYIDEQERIQLEGIERRMLIYRTESLEYQNLNRQREELLLNGSEESQKLTLANMRQQHQERLSAIEAQAWRENMTEQQKNDMIFREDMRFLDEQRILYRQGTLERINLEREISERDEQYRLQREQYYQQQLQQVREQYLSMSNERTIQLELQNIEEVYDYMIKKGIAKETEKQEAILAVKARYANYQTTSERDQQKGSQMLQTATDAAKKDLDGKSGSNTPFLSDIMLYQTTMEKLKELYGNDEKNHAAYLAAKQQATENFCNNLVQTIQVVYNSVNQVLSAASNYFSAQQEYETAQVQKKYEKQIEAAGNNQKKVKKLQEKQHKEEAAIKTKYARRAATIQMAQAVAQTAISAINAYSSAAAIPVTGFVLAPIAAAAAIAAGMLQIATIKKQQQAQEAGYYEGGFTGGRRYRKEAGVVHEGEFVANHQAVQNPAILPFLNFLDQAQRNNTVGSLTAADVSRSLAVGGGSTTPVITPIVNVQNDNADLREAVDANREATELLLQRLEEPINAQVVLTGPNGLNAQQQRLNNMLKNK